MPTLYTSALQHPPQRVDLLIRTEGDPRYVLEAVEPLLKSISAEMELYGERTLADQYLSNHAPLRSFTYLYGFIAALGVLVATVGLTALVSASISIRRREFGLRAALGARPRDLVRLVYRETAITVLKGSGAGLLGAVPLARLLQLLAKGVHPFDPLLFFSFTALLGTMALISGHIPARRSRALDPAVALRGD